MRPFNDYPGVGTISPYRRGNPYRSIGAPSLVGAPVHTK
jgi:hypothetical protein